MAARERVRALRKQASELERASDWQDRSEAYIAALRNERAGYEHRLARARQLGDGYERISDGAGHLRNAEQSGNEIAAMLETRIRGVDAELETRIAAVDAELARCRTSARPE